MLHVGFATACITPAMGKEIPGLFHQRLAEGTHDDLYARASVIDDGRTCVAFVQTDMIKVPEHVVAGARKGAHRLCGIPGKNCFIAATHTHSGGPIFGGFSSMPDADYEKLVIARVATAIADAHRQRRPAVAGTGSALAEGVAFNRRFIMKDGSQTTHPGKMNPDIVEPAGPEDPTVTVVGFREPGQEDPFGCVVTFACHGTHMNGELFSADYPYWVVETLRAVYGPDFGVVFLNGACGDVTQVDNQSPRPGEMGPYWCERTGRTVGAGAVQALARMDYFRKASVDSQSTTVQAEIRDSGPAAVKAAKALLAKKKMTHKDVETIYANETLQVARLRKENPKRKLELQGVRVADAFFWGVPGEFFQSFAMEVRDDSPFRHTCCVELANGYNGYICTKAAFAGGGYEIRTARSSLLVKDTGERVVRAAGKLRDRMHSSARKELEALPKLRMWDETADDAALDGINQLTRKRRKG